MTKPEMLKQGIKSPNMADAVMMLMRPFDVTPNSVDIDFEGW